MLGTTLDYLAQIGPPAITIEVFPRNESDRTGLSSVAYAENFHEGGFIQWHRVVICICCALFVTSQFDVIVLFPNQRFSEVR